MKRTIVAFQGLTMYSGADSQAIVHLPGEKSQDSQLDPSIVEKELREWINCVLVPALVNKYLREKLLQQGEE